jgi:hypothetical protein
MTTGTVFLIALAILCLFSVGERTAAELGWPRTFAVLFLAGAALGQTVPVRLAVWDLAVQPVGLAFALVGGLWALHRTRRLGERVYRVFLSVALCALWTLLWLMLWSGQGTWEALVPGAVCGVVAAMAADSRAGTVACALLGTLAAEALFIGYSALAGTMQMTELGAGQGWDIHVAALWCALWAFELKDLLRRYVFVRFSKRKKAA